MNLLIGSILQLHNKLNENSTKENIDDKIFKLRKEIKHSKKKYDPKDIVDDEENVYYIHENKGRREHLVRQILESIFQKRFPSCRPEWLVNHKTKRKLEIDCYNSELRIAVEIDGEQHCRYLPHFHKNYENYLKQQERDLLKTKLILQRGLRLIRIPYSIPTNELEKYILSKLNEIF